MKFQINKKLLPVKGFYFLFNAGVSPIQPFMPVLAKDLNIPKNAFGIINGILPFAGMLAKPLFGALADRYRLHKCVFILFQIITIIGFFNLQFISKLESDSSNTVKLVCGAETNFNVCFNSESKNVECLIDDFLKASNLNRTVKCSLKCDLSSDLRTELCGPWRANPQICTESIVPESDLSEYTLVNGESEKIANRVNGNHSSTPLDGVKVDFVASIPLQHTLKVSNCLYFRVADAQLNDETHHIPYCKNEVDTNCQIHCSDSMLTELLEQNKDINENVDFVHYYQFWLFLFLAILGWVGMAVVVSVADAVCFEVLGDKPGHYGRQRLWGSIGWGIFAFISGLLIDKFSSNDRTNYTPSLYLMLIVLLCSVICSYSLKYEQTKVSTNIFKNVGKLLCNVWIDVFLFWCVVIGMCTGVQWSFLLWHLEELIEQCNYQSILKTLLGLVSAVECFCGELPSFFLFSWIIKKLEHVHLMTIIPLCVGVRFILYSFLTNPWWVLPVELFQFSLGLTFATMASYASIVAPPGAEATVQGLVGAVFEGIGVSLGGYLGGIIFKSYGGRVLFQIFSSLAFGLGIIHGLGHYFLGKNSKGHVQGKDFNGIAKYATPNEAVSMLDDT